MPRTRSHDPQAFVPLPSAALHVLLAIGAEERHGYGIMGEVQRITGGAVRMGSRIILHTTVQANLP
jgi:hypothetical protein